MTSKPEVPKVYERNESIMKPRFDHQLKYFELTKDLPAFAFEWEPRVGKTIPAIDTAIYLYEQGKTDAAVIVAPNGVKLAWSRENIFEYREELDLGRIDVNKDSRKVIDESIIFEFPKSNSKKAQERCEEVLNHPGMVWLCLNIEGIADRLNKYGSIATSKMQVYLEKFIAKRKCILINDESHTCKHLESKCTKAMIRLSKGFPYRRNLTGTPVTQSPFDLYPQYHILDPMIIHNYINQPMKYSAFKQRFGYWKKTYVSTHSFMELDKEQGDKGYKDLDHLYALINPYRSRLTKKDVFKNYKEPIYDKIFYEMPENHRKVYDEILDELITRLDNGEEITAANKLVQMLRLQQISRGYVGGTADGKIVELGPPYPAVDELLNLIEKEDGKIIVWCIFKADVDLVLKSLNEKGIKSLRYDGQIQNEDRQKALVTMREDPSYKVIVGTPAAGGIGVDMSFADVMIFYSFNYNLDERIQAISRFEGPKQISPSVLHVDMVCVDTNDSRCLDALSGKEDLADILTGDKERFKKFLMGERK